MDEVTSTGLPLGFAWGAVRAGIKASGNLDVALALAAKGTNGAAVFTRNQVVAAPVMVGRRHLSATGGRVSAVLVNAGNANCATGEAGVRACVTTCKAAAEAVGCIFDEVVPSSTGIIGVPLPVEKMLAVIPELVRSLGSDAGHAEEFARAMLTTDTRMKVARAEFEAEGRQVRLFGVAKGAGMIAPRLGAPVGGTAGDGGAHATMLVYLFSDIAASSGELGEMLTGAVEESFNSISIDGDTSTNDTVLLLASGKSGVALDVGTRPAMERALEMVCGSLAHQIVDDGEGVKHLVTLQVAGAATIADARQVARTIAQSPLNKCAWSSADPNWGRLLAAAGYSGVTFSPERVTVWIGDQVVYENGMRAVLFDELAAHATMSQREYVIRFDLGEGSAGCSFLTCDLTEEYVRINADYST